MPCEKLPKNVFNRIIALLQGVLQYVSWKIFIQEAASHLDFNLRFKAMPQNSRKLGLINDSNCLLLLSSTQCII